MSKLVENYLLQEPVGKGVYGQVFRAIHQENKGVFAVKVIPKASFRSNPKLQQLAINEINILSSIKHNNIVRFIETLKTPNNFYFVYEFCNEGTLESILIKRKFLKENEALIYFRQLLEAFKQLNKNNIMHRDLKPDNIFLSDGVVKLGDFGFCKMLEVNMAQTMLGSPIYMAPQVLKEEIYTSKADIWSLGVVLFEMLFGYCPFESSSISQLINKLKETEVQIPHKINKISEQTQILIRKMLVKDQFKRIEWADLFDFNIDETGKIISGCKKQFAIETLERYFLSDNPSSTEKSLPVIPVEAEKVEKVEQKFAFKKIQSDKKASSKTVPSGSDNKIESNGFRPYTANFIPHSDEHPLSQNKQPQSKSDDKSLSQPSGSLAGSLKDINLRSTSDSPSKSKKLEKQKFSEKHTRWYESVKLLEDLALNSIDANSEQLCIYLLLKKLLNRIEFDCQYYPEWTDVLIEEKRSIADIIEELKLNNENLCKYLEGEKQNEESKDKKELLKIWGNARNKFTLERAIRAAYDRPSKDISIEQILAS